MEKGLIEMNLPKPFKNIYCTDRDDMVIEWKCECCNKCYLYVQSNKIGSCPYGGPFSGYIREDEKQEQS